MIGETGAEGIKDADGSYGVKVNNALISALTTEDQQAKNHTIPTFLFETIDEPGKADGQRQMGFFSHMPLKVKIERMSFSTKLMTNTIFQEPCSLILNRE